MKTKRHKTDTINGLIKMQAYAIQYLHNRFEQTNLDQYTRDIETMKVVFEEVYNKINE